MSMEPVHIAFCVNDSYVPYVTVTIKSIIENHRECDVFIHVLTDSVSKQSKMLLEDSVIKDKNIHLQIHIVNDTSLKGVKTGVWTIYTWYRVLLPQILSEEIKRVLYLDADTTVAANLTDLFTMDMTNKSIAASIDTQSFKDDTFERCGYDKSKRYICAGILLINLEYWRKHNLAQQMIDWAILNYDRIGFPDQDAINYICQDTKIVLPLRYGILNAFYLDDTFYKAPYTEELYDCIYDPAIIHYAGCYPWIKYFANHLMQSEWDKYNKMLDRPVRATCIPCKWCYVKIMISDMLHPFRKRNTVTMDDVKKRLSVYK